MPIAPGTAAPAASSAAVAAAPVVRFDRVSLAFDDDVVLRDVSFGVDAGRMLILLGGSGAGKSIVLRLVLGLIRPDAGEIRVFGRRVETLTEHELMVLRGSIGMLFQESALFDSLTVLRDAFHIATHQLDGGSEPRFIMLRDGDILFEGTADELRASADPYLRRFVS